jgi:hypothetical protein
MIRKGCVKIHTSYGLTYLFRHVSHTKLAWSFVKWEERSGNRVKKYFMKAYKIYGREVMFDIRGRGIYGE